MQDIKREEKLAAAKRKVSFLHMIMPHY